MFHPRPTPRLAALFGAALVAAATTAPANAAPPRVAADTPVAASLTAEVMGGLGEPTTLLPRGAAVHHHQLRPSEAAALQSAELLVWFGPELTPWLGRAAATRATGSDLQLLHVPGTLLRAYGDPQSDAGEAHDHPDHDDAHGHQHDHGQDGIDPHAWLSPANAGPWLRAIAGRLSEMDPDNAATYAANAEAAAARFEALDARLAARLAPVSDQRLVVFHDAYGYFTSHFGLVPVIAVTLGDATTPSAARIAEVRGQITRSGARCAFPEVGQDARLIETAIEGSEVRIGAALDPAGSATAPGANLLGDLLEGIATALTECLDEG